MKNTLTLILLSILFINSSNFAQPLVPDSLFETNSIATYVFPTGPEFTELLDLQNGYILYGGYNYDISQNDFHIDIAKSDWCGDLDSTFGTNGLVHYKFSQRNLAFDFQIQSDSKILTCGIQSTSNSGSQQIPFVARFLENGQPDTTFGTLGSNTLRFDNVSSGRFYAVKEMSDQRVVTMGYSVGNINGGTQGIGAMRFTANGVLDPSFNSGIVRYNISVSNGLGAGFLTNNNDVIAVGGYVDAGFNSHFIVAEWDSTGNLNPAFATGGIFQDMNFIITNDVYAVRDSNGFITMAASAVGSTPEIHMVKLNAAGDPDPSFGTNGAVTVTHPGILACKGIQEMPGNKYLLLGQMSITNTGFCILLNSDGSIDTTFGNMGFVQVDVNAGVAAIFVRGMIELPNGQYIFGGGGAGLTGRRYDFVSNVPHISQNFNYLEVTGNGTYQWYLNNAPIIGAASDTLNFNQNGDYTVELTGDYGCKYMSDPFTVNNTSLQENNLSGFTVFPSITDNILNIHNNNNLKGKVSVVTPQGKFLLTLNLPALETQQINLSDFSAGVYFLRIETANGVFLERIVKI